MLPALREKTSRIIKGKMTMTYSGCTISFFKNDLRRSRMGLDNPKCPVKDCSAHIHKIRFQQYQVPFCPEHGIRIHKNGFVYCNGDSPDNLGVATKRNLLLHGDYYLEHFLGKNNKMESGRLCYENSEDAVSYNVFTSLLSDKGSLEKLFHHITKKDIPGNVELYLWGNKINFNNKPLEYGPLRHVRDSLEHDIDMFKTEPDIMLVIPGKAVVCIEAKFGSKNPIAMDIHETPGEKPKKIDRLIDRYCLRNKIINAGEIFIDYAKMPGLFFEQIFRNIVFAASMAKIEGTSDWYVVNLRNQHLMNLKRGEPESMPIKRNIRSILRREYKNRFSHLTWEDIYSLCVRDNIQLSNLAWYLKNKTLSYGRAFNIF